MKACKLAAEKSLTRKAALAITNPSYLQKLAQSSDNLSCSGLSLVLNKSDCWAQDRVMAILA
jgi:hypothetical protein